MLFVIQFSIIISFVVNVVIVAIDVVLTLQVVA